MKNSFVLYSDQKENFELLTPEECKELILAIFDFNGKMPKLSERTTLASLSIFKQMIRDNTKWEIIKEKRALAGRKGGLKTQENQANCGSEANQANASSGNSSKSSKRVANQAVNVIGIVNGIVNDNVINKESIKKNNGIEKSLVDNFTLEEMEIYRKTKRLPLKVIETVKEDYILWIQSNPTKKECQNRDMAATIKQWISRDIKSGKIVPKKTDQEIIEELEREYGKIEV